MLMNFFKKQINIGLPNFHYNVFLNLCFITLQKNNKSVFKNGYRITNVDGYFPYSIWSIDRDNRYVTQRDMETTLRLYSQNNINVNLIFDNSTICKKDLNDKFSNIILKSAHKEGNGIYVKSNILYEYIKEKYPLYNLFKYATPEEFNQKNILIIDKYNNQIKKNDVKYKENAIITLNPLCPAECKHYEEHRKYIEMEQINYYRVSDIYVCPLKKNFNFYDLKSHSNFITAEKMKDYIKAGFSNFRIEFPTMEKSVDINYGVYDAIESFIYYLIKPEYQQEIRHMISKKFLGNRNG